MFVGRGQHIQLSQPPINYGGLLSHLKAGIEMQAGADRLTAFGSKAVVAHVQVHKTFCNCHGGHAVRGGRHRMHIRGFERETTVERACSALHGEAVRGDGGRPPHHVALCSSPGYVVVAGANNYWILTGVWLTRRGTITAWKNSFRAVTS